MSVKQGAKAIHPCVERHIEKITRGENKKGGQWPPFVTVARSELLSENVVRYYNTSNHHRDITSLPSSLRKRGVGILALRSISSVLHFCTKTLAASWASNIRHPKPETVSRRSERNVTTLSVLMGRCLHCSQTSPSLCTRWEGVGFCLSVNTLRFRMPQW